VNNEMVCWWCRFYCLLNQRIMKFWEISTRL
jgi:hypothetical protein